MAESSSVTFGGRYQLHRRIARGGMADVFLARDQLLDRPVAVKVLFAHYAQDPAFVERFRREAQAAANLTHPNVVAVYDWGEETGTYYIVMEFVSGRSLSELLGHEGTLLPERAADVAIDIAAALGFAHRNGVVHRDIKPGNVLISSDGQVKVADFGIARAISKPSDENLTQAGLVMGTATYFSPEQAQGRNVDPRSDLYSLGVVLYEMVCGSPPFRGEDALSVAYQHVKEPPPHPTSINPGLDPTLEAIILKSLAKSTSDRYASAEDLRTDLRRYREGHRIPNNATMAQPATNATRALPPSAGPATAVASAYDTDYQGYDNDYYDDAPGYAPATKRNNVFVGLLVVMLLFVGGLVYMLGKTVGVFGGDKKTPEVTTVVLPDVVNKPFAEAETQLRGLGLEVDKKDTQTTDPNIPPGTVTDQDPDTGKTVDIGSTVTLTVVPEAKLTKVPDVRGMTEVEAKERLQTDGFLSTTVDTQADVDVPKGEVISTDPPADVEVSVTTSIKLIISGGPETKLVPELSNKTQAEAEAILNSQGFKSALKDEFSDTIPLGRVIRTEPAAGSEQATGATITLVISQGADQVTVPDVTEKTESSARGALETAGFLPNVEYTELPPGDRNIGRVVSQSPNSGTKAAKKSTITIVVGKEAPPAPTTSSSDTTLTTPTI